MRDSLDGGGIYQMASESWTTLPAAVFESILGSGCTYEFQRPEWPNWARGAPQVQRVIAYALAPGETIPSIQTTGTVVARLLTERYDPKDEAPFNYNWYAVVQSSNGAFYQSGPHRDVDFGHHLSRPISNLSLGLGP